MYCFHLYLDASLQYCNDCDKDGYDDNSDVSLRAAVISEEVVVGVVEEAGSGSK